MICPACAKYTLVYTDPFKSQQSCYTCGYAVSLSATGEDDFNIRVEHHSQAPSTPKPWIIKTVDRIEREFNGTFVEPYHFKDLKLFLIDFKPGTALRNPQNLILSRLVLYYFTWQKHNFRSFHSFWYIGADNSVLKIITKMEKLLRKRLFDADMERWRDKFHVCFDLDHFIMTETKLPLTYRQKRRVLDTLASNPKSKYNTSFLARLILEEFEQVGSSYGLT